MTYRYKERDRWFAELIIYDVGMNTCQDTDYYLKKGFKVVAIEANPVLCQAARKRYLSEIESGRLVILNVGISDKKGEFPFFVCKERPEWSSFYQSIAGREGFETETITISTVTLDEVIQQYGVPYYLKIDIEGLDEVALLSALNGSYKIPFVSVENGGTMLRTLHEHNYDAFQYIQQRVIPTLQQASPASEGLTIEHQFVHGASGKFGEELEEEWCDFDTIYPVVSAVWNVETGAKNAQWNDAIGGWFDLHARHKEFASAVEHILQLNQNIAWLNPKKELPKKSPYANLPASRFWKTGVVDAKADVDALYEKKWEIPSSAKIATAGSCFAQHISKHLKSSGYHVLDVEPVPPCFPGDEAKNYGYNIYSARYGNIYTVQQLLQLAQEAYSEKEWEPVIWQKDGKYYDARRPGILPNGFSSEKELRLSRRLHLAQVKNMFNTMDVFIFTLGLTEHWVKKDCGAVLPIAPGIIAGEFDEKHYEFRNAAAHEVVTAFNTFQKLLIENRPVSSRVKYILTVSPVPLTATYSGQHILVANTYSKAVLRMAAGQVSTNQSHVDYFPSYEIVNHPGLAEPSFEPNLRTVRQEAVAKVMRVFFAQHPVLKNNISPELSHSDYADESFEKCEELLLQESFRE